MFTRLAVAQAWGEAATGLRSKVPDECQPSEATAWGLRASMGGALVVGLKRMWPKGTAEPRKPPNPRDQVSVPGNPSQGTTHAKALWQAWSRGLRQVSG